MRKKYIYFLSLAAILSFFLSYTLLKLFYPLEKNTINTDLTNTTLFINNAVPDLSDETDKRYEEIKDKSQIDYNSTIYDSLFYETENGLSTIELISEIPRINDKSYTYILDKFSYCSELDSIDISLDEAIRKIEKVLPDDIVENKRKIDTNTGNIYIFYTSSIGNFVVSLKTGILECINETYSYDMDRIVGISYLKEI